MICGNMLGRSVQ